MKHTTILGLLAASVVPASAFTTFLTDSNSLVGAQWDIWSDSGESTATGGVVAPTSGLDQGSAQSTFGSIALTSSSVTTDITQAYETPPGGFLFNPDTFYIHNGAFDWNVSLNLESTVNFARVSYALVGSDLGPTNSFGTAPTIAGASLLGSGAYTAGANTVFYYDFELATPSSNIETSFGDLVSPGFYPGSFRSMDSILIEGLNVAPDAIPEPSAALLGLLGLTLTLRRKRN